MYMSPHWIKGLGRVNRPNISARDIGRWTKYVGSGGFVRDFPNLKVIDVEFTSFRGFAQTTFLSPMGTKHSDSVVEAMNSNVKADI